MIFKIKDGEEVSKTNPAIGGIREFTKVPDSVLKYTFYMYDYDSPYSRLPIDKRKDHVCTALGMVKKQSVATFVSRYKDKLSSVKLAFSKLQYNSDNEALISLTIQLHQWNELLRKEDKSEKEQALAQKIFDKMPEYIERKKKLEEIVGYREIYEDSSEDDDKSSIEEYLQSKRA